MYGLVNQAIEDLVKTNFGEQEWQIVKAKAGFDEPVFIGKKHYSDDLTLSLVHAACEVFMQSPEILLQLVGRHWIMFTGREGWHEYFDVTCTDSIGFLKQLKNMHQRVLEEMPDAKPPKIELKEVADGYELDYISDRDGLALFFKGVVEGLVEYYEEAWVIEQIKYRADDGIDRFRLRLVSTVLKHSADRHAA